MKSGSFRGEVVFPSLFWRIDEAEQARHGRGVSVAMYRAEVLRNLRWLLNSVARPESDPIWDLPQASSSVLNFGVPPYTGRVGSMTDGKAMARAIKQAILRFEPRILADSVEVELVEDPYDEPGSFVAFRISGSIWCQPVPERFSMETTVDTASGAWSFES